MLDMMLGLLMLPDVSVEVELHPLLEPLRKGLFTNPA